MRMDQNGTLGATASLTLSTLAVGTHVISVEARDANNILSRAATTITIGQNGGVPCVSGDTCLSGYCTGYVDGAVVALKLRVGVSG